MGWTIAPIVHPLNPSLPGGHGYGKRNTEGKMSLDFSVAMDLVQNQINQRFPNDMSTTWKLHRLTSRSRYKHFIAFSGSTTS